MESTVRRVCVISPEASCPSPLCIEQAAKPALKMQDLYRHITLDLMLCGCHPETFNNFIFAFQFYEHADETREQCVSRGD